MSGLMTLIESRKASLQNPLYVVSEKDRVILKDVVRELEITYNSKFAALVQLLAFRATNVFARSNLDNFLIEVYKWTKQ
jgi:hypothetical protein